MAGNARWTSAEKDYAKKLAKDGKIFSEAAVELSKMFPRTFTRATVESWAKRNGVKFAPANPANRITKTEAKEIKQLKRDRDQLAARLQRLIQVHDTPVAQYMGTSGRFGIVSDTHFGSIAERPDLLEKAYQIMHAEGITNVFHAGDMLEGSGMRRGHNYEIALVGMDAQIQHAVDRYPYYKGMTTRFILGSHDLSFYASAGASPGPLITARRDDLIQLAPPIGESADVVIKIGKTNIHIGIEHPGGGTAYALSYRPQKIVEAMDGGTKPHILILGHYHKSEFVASYRNVAVFQAGCFQNQTDFMKRKALAAHVGFWMVEVRTTKIGIARIKAEFTPFF